MDEKLRTLIARWGAEWGIPDLVSEVSVTFSGRLTRSLGRCRPATGRVTLRKDLRDGDPARLEEVLCHEVAHVAVDRLFGRNAAPHGPEWRDLVTRAGFQPRVRATEAAAPSLKATLSSGVLSYEHRCPVCQSVRFARRPVPRWRCAECLDAGLAGELVITRHPTPARDP